MSTTGTIHQPKTLMLRKHVGEAEDPKTGIKFEMSVGANMSPIIRCEQTDRYFTLSWTDILNLAQEAGIHEH